MSTPWSGLSVMMRVANFNLNHLRATQFCFEKNAELLMVMQPNNANGLELAPLLKAAMLGLLSTVQNLLAEGADANIRYGSDEMSMLDVAALMGHLEIMRALIDHGVDVNDAGPSGETTLHKAVMHGRADVELIDLLLSAGADIEARTTTGSTPLHSATHWPESGGAAAILLHRGAAKHAFDIKGCSPLHRAAMYGRVTATRALLAAGADATLLADGPIKTSPLSFAAEIGQVEVVKEFLMYGVNADASTDTTGYTALHRALINRQTDTVETLLEAGASATAQMYKMRTPLYSAAKRLFLEIMLALLRHGAPVGGLQGDAVDLMREPPLHAAARMGGVQGAAEAVDLLLRWGADESELDSDGKNAVQVIGTNAAGAHVDPERKCSGDADRVRELLANAPADRTWRRRGLLLLCLARHRTTSNRNTGVSEQGGGDGEGGGALTGGGGGASGAGGGGSPENGGGLDDVVASLVVFEQEGFFRTIVGYL